MKESLSKFIAESAKRNEENSNLIKEIQASMDAAIRNQGSSIKALEIQIGKISKDGSCELKYLDSYLIGTTFLDDALPTKEKDPGSFTLPCIINYLCFSNSLADFGASVSVILFSTYTKLGLGELAPTKLYVLDMPEDIKNPLILGRTFLSTAHAKIRSCWKFSAIVGIRSYMEMGLEKKMHFLLSIMSVVHVLTTHILDDGDDAIVDQIRKRAKWDNDDYVCRGLILNDLKFSSGKIVSLFNALHVPNIKKNLVSSSVLNNCGYKQVIESNNFVLSKHGVFIGFGYLSNQMFRLNIVNDNIALAVMEVARLPDPKLKTLGEGGIKCIVIGYAEYSKAFRISLSIPKGTKDIGGSVVPEVITYEVVQQHDSELRKSKRNRTLKDFGPEFQLYLIKGTKDEVSDQHSYCFNVEDDLKTFDEAMKSQDVTFLKEAINDEMDSIMGNNTYTVRLLIAMVLIHNLVIHQMDVKTAFLNGDLDEETPKQWHQKLNEVVLSNGYLLNQVNKCVYRNFDESGKGVIICLYVDDMLMFGTDQVQVDLAKEFLSSKFSMKDMEEANVILGISIKHETVGKEAKWLKNLLFEISLWSKPIAPISIRCDSAATLAKAYSQMYNGKSRHLDARHSMICELITNGVIFIEFFYALSLRERMELDLEARLMGEALILNRSLDPFMIMKDKIKYKGKNAVGASMDVHIFVGNFFVVTDFIVVENIDSYRDEGMGNIIVGRPFCKDACIKAKRFDGMITIYKGNDSVTYQMAQSHPRFNT
uniref:Zinc finger, CCHC-type n=1 Tax=Tanacetum cinerariifolium TaxID=118510 RepID=A0A6L2KPH4_TANCI|nr:zinc finger, CCHC-type [Tanacetum cinerariifolium]